MVGIEKLGLQSLNPYVLNFYFAIVISISLLMIGLISGQLELILPVEAIWLILDCSFNINRWNYLFTTGG